ncbi:hypothetical protein ACQZV8_16205 [Magnetococcales bacterium HHB-1]
MVPLIYYGLSVAAGLLVGKEIFLDAPSSSTRPKAGSLSRFNRPAPAIWLLREYLIQEKTLNLAVEDIPLDNRFGNKVLVSEHEFIRTATISLKLGKNRQKGSSIKSQVWPLLESVVQKELGNLLNIEFGSQITRRVKLTFSTDPGALVKYRVIWRQDSRRGVFETKIGSQIYHIPYLATFGLSHSVESVAAV